jgi:PII-like signaling protein
MGRSHGRKSNPIKAAHLTAVFRLPTRASVEEGNVLTAGPGKKVGVYVAEDQQYHGTSAYAAILDFLFFHGVSGATVTRGIAGFGADHHLHTDRLVDLAAKLPVKVEFIETAEKIEELLPKLQAMVGTGLIEMHDTTIVKPAEKTRKHSAAFEGLPLKREGKAKMMRIYIGENDKWNGKPLYEAIVSGLRAHDIAGVTVYRGILGYGANRRIHKDATLSLSQDRPILLSVVDTEEKLQAFMPVLDQMVQQGLVVLSNVDVVKYTHNYQKAERRQESRI